MKNFQNFSHLSLEFFAHFQLCFFFFFVLFSPGFFTPVVPLTSGPHCRMLHVQISVRSNFHTRHLPLPSSFSSCLSLPSSFAHSVSTSGSNICVFPWDAGHEQFDTRSLLPSIPSIHHIELLDIPNMPDSCIRLYSSRHKSTVEKSKINQTSINN